MIEDIDLERILTIGANKPLSFKHPCQEGYVVFNKYKIRLYKQLTFQWDYLLILLL